MSSLYIFLYWSMSLSLSLCYARVGRKFVCLILFSFCIRFLFYVLEPIFTLVFVLSSPLHNFLVFL
jgi:hypothetical protein